MNVQYGCGLSAPLTWRNFDASPTLRLQKVFGRLIPGPRFPKNAEYGNIVKGLPIPAGSCDAIYASHVLEHLALNDFRAALANTYRHLKPGGLFRLVLPDLEHLTKDYVANGDAMRFMDQTCLGLTERNLLRQRFGNSHHLWMWDFQSMSKELVQAGFMNIRRAAFGDSLPCFTDVEELDRWEPGGLGIECFKTECVS